MLNHEQFDSPLRETKETIGDVGRRLPSASLCLLNIVVSMMVLVQPAIAQERCILQFMPHDEISDIEVDTEDIFLDVESKVRQFLSVSYEFVNYAEREKTRPRSRGNIAQVQLDPDETEGYELQITFYKSGVRLPSVYKGQVDDIATVLTEVLTEKYPFEIDVTYDRSWGGYHFTPDGDTRLPLKEDIDQFIPWSIVAAEDFGAYLETQELFTLTRYISGVGYLAYSGQTRTPYHLIRRIVTLDELRKTTVTVVCRERKGGQLAPADGLSIAYCYGKLFDRARQKDSRLSQYESYGGVSRFRLPIGLEVSFGVFHGNALLATRGNLTVEENPEDVQIDFERKPREVRFIKERLIAEVAGPPEATKDGSLKEDRFSVTVGEWSFEIRKATDFSSQAPYLPKTIALTVETDMRVTIHTASHLEDRKITIEPVDRHELLYADWVASITQQRGARQRLIWRLLRQEGATGHPQFFDALDLLQAEYFERGEYDNAIFVMLVPEMVFNEQMKRRLMEAGQPVNLDNINQYLAAVSSVSEQTFSAVQTGGFMYPSVQDLRYFLRLGAAMCEYAESLPHDATDPSAPNLELKRRLYRQALDLLAVVGRGPAGQRTQEDEHVLFFYLILSTLSLMDITRDYQGYYQDTVRYINSYKASRFANDPAYQRQLNRLESKSRRLEEKYSGEGVTFPW